METVPSSHKNLELVQDTEHRYSGNIRTQARQQTHRRAEQRNSASRVENSPTSVKRGIQQMRAPKTDLHTKHKTPSCHCFAPVSGKE